jgi:N-acetylglucosaminyldiphosphoundecaprenol N-acetyl-beta-D-mannosaminyltransferase
MDAVIAQNRKFLTGDENRPSALESGSLRLRLGRVGIDLVTMEAVVSQAVAALKQRTGQRPLLIVGPNAQLVTLAERNQRFAEAIEAASLSVPDGASVVWASRLLSSPAPERVTGGELMERLCAEAAIKGFTVFFLGGLPGAAAGAAANLTLRYPGLKIVDTYCPPFGFEADPAELSSIRRRITQSSPDLLCVAFGAPKQEIWMHEHGSALPVGVVIAVGAALDTQAGLRRRAPSWTHRLGVEWLYRLACEPRRLWRRYLIGNTYFVWLVLRQWLKTQSSSSPLHPSHAAGGK